MHFDRRSLMILAGAAAAGFAATAGPVLAITPVGTDDMVLGSGPVTVIEYASASCPHCARWSMEVFPEFRRRFIDTGQVRFVLREFLTDPAELAAAGFLTARCGGRARYFDILEDVFAAQAEIYESRDVAGPLSRVAARHGISRERFNACLSDPRALQALQDRVTRWSENDEVNSTPTFIVGSQRLVGEQTIDALARAIARARGGRPADK